jgi:hypothetical protein
MDVLTVRQQCGHPQACRIGGYRLPSFHPAFQFEDLMPPRFTCFISYPRLDNALLMRELVDDLEVAVRELLKLDLGETEVFVDESQLRPGAKLDDRIAERFQQRFQRSRRTLPRPDWREDNDRLGHRSFARRAGNGRLR